MKKVLYSLAVLLAGMTSFTSCSDDDATYTPIEPLTVLSADVLFDMDGGTGTIVVDAPSVTATLTTAASWVTMSTSENTVTVSVPRNPTVNGRSATIKLTYDDKEAYVTATQKGYAYGFTDPVDYTIDDKPTSLTVGLNHFADVTVTSLADWITASFDEANSQVVVNASENATGTFRTGQVVVESSRYSDTITVTQIDYAKDVYGEYLFFYYNNNSKTTLYALNAMLTEDTLFIDLGEKELNYVPITFEEESLSFTATAGSYCGTYDNNGTPLYMRLLFGDGDTGYWTAHANTTATSTAYLSQIELTDGTKTLYANLDQSGTFGSNNHVSYWNFQVYRNDVFPTTATNSAGTLLRAHRPYLMKVPPGTDSSSARSALIKRVERANSNKFILQPGADPLTTE